MKKLLLAGVAALFLATGTALGQEWPATTFIENLAAKIFYENTCGVSNIDPKFVEWHTKFLKKLNDLASSYPEEHRRAADQKIKRFIQQVT